MEPREPAGKTPARTAGRLGVTADRGDQGVRLDLVLLRHAGGGAGVSRQRLQHAIKQGWVTINGVTATRVAARVALGDRIEAQLALAERAGPPEAQPLPLDVLFEDEHLLAVNKRAGIVVHPAYKHPGGTLLNAVLWHLSSAAAETAGGSPGIVGAGSDAAPRLLYRLDKDTSGVILFAKTRGAYAGVASAARAGKVRKQYLAVVHGTPRPSRGTITLPLARDRVDTRRVAVDPSGGKASATRYEVRCTSRHGASHGCGRSTVSLVLCELVTGRMHQIRVHLAARGWPIVGDRVYGAWDPASAGLRAASAGLHPAAAGSRTPTASPPRMVSPIARQALHAWRIALPHPMTGESLVITGAIPDDMRTLMNAAGLAEGEQSG